MSRYNIRYMKLHSSKREVFLGSWCCSCVGELEWSSAFLF